MILSENCDGNLENNELMSHGSQRIKNYFKRSAWYAEINFYETDWNGLRNID